VKFSPVLSWFVLVVLVLTLGWKVAVRPDTSAEIEKKQADSQRKLADFLVRQHFTIVPEKKTLDLPIIRATAGACRILVFKPSFDGSDRERIRRYTSASDTLFVVFGGRIYAEQPTFLTVSDELWARLRRQLGLKAEAAPLFVVIANKGCEAERLPWHELGRYKHIEEAVPPTSVRATGRTPPLSLLGADPRRS
jgi:hypothetical protein